MNFQELMSRLADLDSPVRETNGKLNFSSTPDGQTSVTSTTGRVRATMDKDKTMYEPVNNLTIDQAKRDPRYGKDPEFTKEVDNAEQFANSLTTPQGQATQPFKEADKSDKDYDDDGEIESPKDEVWGSRAKAAAKAGTPFKEENDEDEKVTSDINLDELAQLAGLSNEGSLSDLGTSLRRTIDRATLPAAMRAEYDRKEKEADNAPSDPQKGQGTQSNKINLPTYNKETVDATFEKGIEEIADEVDECGDMMGSMGSMPSRQQDNVSMNLSMNGSGSGGIRDLMNILRNLEDGKDDMHHGNDKPLAQLISKEPMLGDAALGGGGFDAATTEPGEIIAPVNAAFPSGDDLHKSKNSYSDKPYRGDNPMALESIKNRLSSLYAEIKTK